MRNRLWALFLMCALSALPTSAQETRGSISGTVRDSTGVIPGASVTVTNVDTGQSQTLTTGASGFYSAPLLNPGKYTVSVSMPSYKPLTNSGITLTVGQQLVIDATIEPGAVTEKVDVIAEAPLLDTSAVAAGQSFDEIERVLPASIAIEFVPEVGLPRVSADRSQMEQVLMNLCPAAMAGRSARTVLPRSGSIADGCLTDRR